MSIYTVEDNFIKDQPKLKEALEFTTLHYANICIGIYKKFEPTNKFHKLFRKINYRYRSNLPVEVDTIAMLGTNKKKYKIP